MLPMFVRAGAMTLALVLASCGFHLRGAATYAFESMSVIVPVGPFGTELKRTLAGASQVRIVDSPPQAQVILEVFDIADDKSVLSLSPGGRAREFALVKRVSFRLRDNNGAEWLPQDDIVIRRTYIYDDTERLAREIQEQRMLKEMQGDAIQQIVRRLQAAKKPA